MVMNKKDYYWNSTMTLPREKIKVMRKYSQKLPEWIDDRHKSLNCEDQRSVEGSNLYIFRNLNIQLISILIKI